MTVPPQTPHAPTLADFVSYLARYCHAFDCVGAAWLHEHVETNYNFCWQQGLGDGEWDAAVCDIGTSRWFNCA